MDGEEIDAAGWGAGGGADTEFVQVARKKRKNKKGEHYVIVGNPRNVYTKARAGTGKFNPSSPHGKFHHRGETTSCRKRRCNLPQAIYKEKVGELSEEDMKRRLKTISGVVKLCILDAEKRCADDRDDEHAYTGRRRACVDMTRVCTVYETYIATAKTKYPLLDYSGHTALADDMRRAISELEPPDVGTITMAPLL